MEGARKDTGPEGRWLPQWGQGHLVAGDASWSSARLGVPHDTTELRAKSRQWHVYAAARHRWHGRIPVDFGGGRAHIWIGRNCTGWRSTCLHHSYGASRRIGPTKGAL
jgi:hypothetical protein